MHHYLSIHGPNISDSYYSEVHYSSVRSRHILKDVLSEMLRGTLLNNTAVWVFFCFSVCVLVYLHRCLWVTYMCLIHLPVCVCVCVCKNSQHYNIKILLSVLQNMATVNHFTIFHVTYGVNWAWETLVPWLRLLHALGRSAIFRVNSRRKVLAVVP